MEYVSTRDNEVRVSAARAIAQGISKDYGLFVPEKLPVLTRERLEGLLDKTYVDRAADVLTDFLTDFTAAEIADSVQAAYGTGNFAAQEVAPLVPLTDSAYVLELWHGPTCAFKDMALQLLPYLLTLSAKKEAAGKEIVILVATSGDTGKAALEGFKDVPGTKILVFYPQDGVSNVQKRQMASQEGANVAVQGVYGNFDDAQTGVKQIFTDSALAQRLADNNLMFSSANSINWGRLVPQIVYYVSAYCDMVKRGDIALGEKVNVCVPTGNFGNILAAYYATEMGVPLGKLICASNVNNVLSDFMKTGVYDRRRDLHLTSSPSMDILISSNLERLLYDLSGRDDKLIGQLMTQLMTEGCYQIPNSVKAKMDERFWGGFVDEATVATTIKDTYETKKYLMDTHTAVGVAVYNQYAAQTGDTTKTIIASTANPYKFSESILEALGGAVPAEGDDFAPIDALQAITGAQVPAGILRLKDLPIRFTESCQKDDMVKTVEAMLNL